MKGKPCHATSVQHSPRRDIGDSGRISELCPAVFDRDVLVLDVAEFRGLTSPSFTLKSIQQMMGRPTPITWNHRVLLIEEHSEKSYCIHEVHYDEDGSVMGWTQNAIAVFVPSFAELILM